MIRIANKEDIEQIAEIHIKALPGDLLPKLGKQYLINEFYPLVINPELALNLVNDVNGVINAFCIFTYNGNKMINLLTKNKLVLFLYGMKSLMHNLSLLGEVFSLLKGPHFQIDSDDKNILDSGLPEIFIIATDPNFQGNGIGKQLIENGLSLLYKNHSACLVRTSSTRAVNFYLKNGFTLFGKEYRGKRNLFLLMNYAKA